MKGGKVRYRNDVVFCVVLRMLATVTVENAAMLKYPMMINSVIYLNLE